MTAMVGEVSSFNIHKTMSSMEESSKTNNSQDIYLIQDKSGDYYALQEVDDNVQSRPANKNVTAHIINAGNVSNQRSIHTRGFNGHASTTSPGSSTDSSGVDYIMSSPSLQQGGDLVIDGEVVEEDKAREVITAYLDSQQTAPTNKGHRYGTYYDSGAVKQSGALKQVQTQGDLSSQSQTSGQERNITYYNPQYQSDTLTNSTVTLKNQVNARVDNAQTWIAPGFEPHTVGSGAENSHTSAVRIANLNTPNQTVVVTQRGRPHVEDTGMINGQHISTVHSHPLSINTNQHSHDIAPFQTTPISITTTTQAVVGEKVDMQIEFPPQAQQHRVLGHTASTTTDATDSSGDETNSPRYVIRGGSPKKSSLKKTSKYDSSSFNDSSSDIVYTKKETVEADINIGGKTREIKLKSVHPASGQYHQTINVNNDRSSDGHVYKVYSNGRAPSPPSRVNQGDNWDNVHKTYHQRSSYSLPRSSSEHNLSYGGHYTTAEKSRGRAKHRIYTPREVRGPASDSGRSYKGRHSKQAHSPERFFRNAKLSLRKESDGGYGDDTDTSRGYYSEHEAGNPRRYKTVTKVFLNGDELRSRSPSPTSRNFVVKSGQNDESQSSDRHYRVMTSRSHSRDGSPDNDDDEVDGFRRNAKRYRVFGHSDSALNMIGGRTISVYNHNPNKSMDEATITRTQRFQPSSSSEPRTGKSHRSVINLELGGDKRIRHTSLSDDASESRFMVKQSNSMDDYLEPTIVPVNTAPPPSPPTSDKLWRTSTARSRSFDSASQHSSSNSYDADAVKTWKQKSGNKMYVVHSTVGEAHDSHGNVIHPPGWFKSTIDINENHPQHSKTEKSVFYTRPVQPTKTFTTEFVSPDSGTGTEIASSDGENESRSQQKYERVERIYEVRTEPTIPEHLRTAEELQNDLRVLRGNILIKNRLDESDHADEDNFDENANLFDSSFHLGKDNPLYSSDQDLLESLRREEEEEMCKHVTQDITFEQIERIAHRHKGSSEVKLSPKPRRKQNLSTLLLSKIAGVDSKDIRQTIDVEHHNEEIFGDIDFIHADGARMSSKNTSNFDSVNENVELTLTQGKAYVIIKVIAERIVPTDYEFNVWRKSQAIVTRRIEIDLLANEQRRRLYQDVMNSAGPVGAIGGSDPRGRSSRDDLSPQERQLSSMETLRLFSQILDVADGQGDRDHTDMRTKQEMGQLPGTDHDLLY